jgi:hypothetical protein
MVLKQLSVFLENKAGRLADATAVLAAAGVNVRAISIADFGLAIARERGLTQAGTF